MKLKVIWEKARCLEGTPTTDQFEHIRTNIPVFGPCKMPGDWRIRINLKFLDLFHNHNNWLVLQRLPLDTCAESLQKHSHAKSQSSQSTLSVSCFSSQNDATSSTRLVSSCWFWHWQRSIYTSIPGSGHAHDGKVTAQKAE
jgi:hypothetical protein